MVNIIFCFTLHLSSQLSLIHMAFPIQYLTLICRKEIFNLCVHLCTFLVFFFIFPRNTQHLLSPSPFVQFLVFSLIGANNIKYAPHLPIVRRLHSSEYIYPEISLWSESGRGRNFCMSRVIDLLLLPSVAFPQEAPGAL